MFDNIGEKIQGAVKFVLRVRIDACARTGVIRLCFFDDGERANCI